MFRIMREIKFRAKAIENNTWVYGMPVESANGVWYMIHGATEDAINTPNETDFYFTVINCETIGQLVGIKDKNKKEIYEGDVINVYGEIRIVTFERGWWMSFTPEQFYELYVDSGCLPAGFATHIDENDYKTIKPLYRYHEPEVIGNIYENKSLLENV